MTFASRFVRGHLAALAAITCVTAWFSYAYFHIDEYFQVIELARFKLGQVDEPLPWEHAERIRPWLQPFLYWLLARGLGAFGVRDVFDLAFAFRLVTGLANIGALALFLRTTLPWLKTEEEQRLHVRVVTLAGFLPYLFVRTSSESASMAALTAGWSLLLEGATKDENGAWRAPRLSDPTRALLGGLLFGVAFELRFQTAILTLGVLAWLRLVAKTKLKGLGLVAASGILALALGALVDRWGYGVWTFPAWSYLKVNVFEGAAGAFGTDLPMAYLWMLPANVFLPVLVALIACAIVAWLRCPRHPLTWTTLPFFLVHNLLSHKEERFLFPLAIFATALVTMAIAPSAGKPLRVASWGWSRRWSFYAKALALSSTGAMGLLAFVPLGWHHNVRFARHVHDRIGDEVHAMALPEINLNLPPFRPRIYDIEKADPQEVARRIEAGTARPWLISDRPILRTGAPGLDDHATLEWSELPFRDPSRIEKAMELVDAYNARVKPPFRLIHFRSLYRLSRR